jgi:hypothetical protein
MTVIRIFSLVLLLLMLNPCIAQPERLDKNESQLLIYWQGEFSSSEKAKLRDWLMQATDTILLLNGTLPRKEIRIELTPVDIDGAVPFARVLRSNPQGIKFYVNPTRPLDEFIKDWTAYHEFTHLFIEYPGQADIWFSEGLASYYQNILQYRAGLLTASETKTKLRNGFQRGTDNDGHSDLTLKQLSKNMHQRNAYMRIYWSGALYFLEADTALRNSSKPSSLDEVLHAYGQCCLTSRQRSGLSMAKEFDRIAERSLFVPLYETYQQTTGIPDYQAIMQNPAIDMIFSK